MAHNEFAYSDMDEQRKSQEHLDTDMLLEQEKYMETNKRIALRFYFIHITLLLINLVGFVRIARFEAAKREFPTVYSPVRDVVKYRTELWDLELDRTSDYVGAPGAQVDALWDEISMGPNVGFLRVQNDELEKINDTSVALADGSGYMVGIEVFHQLHCLNYLRRHLYNSTYKLQPDQESIPAAEHIREIPNVFSLLTYKWNASEPDISVSANTSIAHCIDSIRLALQCQADISLIPFRWASGFPAPWPDFRTKHECRNFDDILEWAKSRQPDLKGLLVHPVFGEVSSAEITSVKDKFGLKIPVGDTDYIE